MWNATLVMAVILSVIVGTDATGGETVSFVDVTAEAGLTFRHTHGGRTPITILETMGVGAGFFDYDGDGDLDIYAVNGNTLRVPDGSSPTNVLYRNEGNGTFTEVTAIAGVGDRGYGMGCTFGDYDNDGDLDLYVTNYGPNVLYRNNGDGTFSDVTDHAGVGDEKWGVGSGFLDYDNDGDLDLYVVNYLDFRMEGLKWCFYNNVKAACTPHKYPPQPNLLYRNNGDGTFTDVAEKAGVADPSGKGMGCAFGDYDNDGDLDIYVANDQGADVFYRNDGDGTFTDVALFTGLGYNENGVIQASMTADFGDYDNDGYMDIFVTAFSDESNQLYHNDGDGFFTNATPSSGLGKPSFRFTSWGTSFFDYDNDGDQDLLVANGHVYDVAPLMRGEDRFEQQNQLFKNNGEGTFTDVSSSSGPGLLIEKPSRGAAFGDYDEDGDIDVYVVNLNDRPTLLRNDGGNRNHWLRIKLVGVESNRDGIGARVKVASGDLVQIKEVVTGSSYLSQSDLRVSFGLGGRDVVDRVEVRWPSGTSQTVRDVDADRTLILVEPTGAERVTAAPARKRSRSGRLDVPAKPLRTYPEMTKAHKVRARPLVSAPDRPLAQPPSTERTTKTKRTATRGTAGLSHTDMGVNDLYRGRYDEALEELKRAIEIDASDAQAHYNLGRVYLITDSLLAARDEFVRAIEIAPNNPFYHMDLGLLYLRLREFDAGRRALERAIEIDYDNPTIHFYLGLVHFKEREYDEATEAFRRAANLSDDPQAHYYLGLTLYRQNREGEAIEAYTRALQIDPDHPEAHNGLGLVYSDQRRYDRAIAAFKAAIQADPFYADAHYNLGKVYWKQERKEEGQREMQIYKRLKPYMEKIKEHRETIRLSPGSAEAHCNLATLYADLGGYSQAREEYEKAIALDPEFIRAYIGLGMIHQLQGDLEGAIEQYKKAIERDPNSAMAHGGLGDVYLNRGRYDRAIAEYRKVIGMSPSPALATRAYAALGKAYQNQGKFDKAIGTYRSALEIKPGSAKIHSDLGRTYQKRGMLEQATRAYKRALEIDPDLAEAHVGLAETYQQRAMIDEAIAEYRKVIKLRPDMVILRTRLAAAYWSNGMIDEAIEEYREVIATFPSLADGYEGLAKLYAQEGIHLDEALRLAQEAVRLRPGPDTYGTLDLVHSRCELSSEAQEVTEKALRDTLDVK